MREAFKLLPLRLDLRVGRDELAALARQLAENPNTRKDFLKLTKQVNPNLPVPELEIEERTEKVLTKAQERVEQLENKLDRKSTRLNSSH